VVGLIHQAQLALPGVIAHGELLGLSYVDGDEMTVHITDAIMGRDAHDVAKADWLVARGTVKTQKKSGRTLSRLSREVLRPYLGDDLNDIVAAAGYPRSFAIPTKEEELVQMLQRLKAHFTLHPEHENLPLNATAARAGTVATDIVNASTTALQKKLLVATKKTERDAKIALLRKDLTTLLSELHVALDPLSDYWAAFGFKKPGILALPDVPRNVTAVLIGTNAAAVKWDKAARGKNYRIFKRVVGVDEEWVYVDTRSDLDFTIEGLPSGATVEIAVSASNNGGESAKSAIATVMTLVA
jgi:hypothetical protein